jgi:hypothetical protein
MNNIDRKAATGDISDMLCDGCLARLEQWLAGGTTPHEFLECLLITGKESALERFFCSRCTGKLYELKAVLIPQLESKNDTSV